MSWAPEEYGEAWASIYDVAYPDLADETGPAVELLAALAGDGGRVLELGVGTGRLALPLAARALDVTGVDASARMLARLRDKDPGGSVAAVQADMAALDALLPGPYDLVFVVFNTLFALPSQDAQVSCVEGAARRLRPGGRFVVDAFVPRPQTFDQDGTVNPCSVGNPE